MNENFLKTIDYINRAVDVQVFPCAFIVAGIGEEK